jgi:trehalose 6-phosphate phosphatase
MQDDMLEPRQALPNETVGRSDEASLRLSPARHAFFLDVDGTLLDIAARPDAVVVPDGLVSDLARLSEKTDGAVALVSGRSVAMLDLLLAPLRLPAAGLHGLELRIGGGDAKAQAPSVGEALDGARKALGALVAADGRLLLEDKGAALALHFRRAPERGAELSAHMRRYLAGAPNLVLQAGKSVIELRLAGPHKGDALAAIMAEEPFKGRTPVAFGDDLTDHAMLAAARALGGVGVHIGPAPAPAEAMLALPHPAALRALLAGGGVSAIGWE